MGTSERFPGFIVTVTGISPRLISLILPIFLFSNISVADSREQLCRRLFEKISISETRQFKPSDFALSHTWLGAQSTAFSNWASETANTLTTLMRSSGVNFFNHLGWVADRRKELESQLANSHPNSENRDRMGVLRLGQNTSAGTRFHLVKPDSDIPETIELNKLLSLYMPELFHPFRSSQQLLNGHMAEVRRLISEMVSDPAQFLLASRNNSQDLEALFNATKNLPTDTKLPRTIEVRHCFLNGGECLVVTRFEISVIPGPILLLTIEHPVRDLALALLTDASARMTKAEELIKLGSIKEAKQQIVECNARLLSCCTILSRKRRDWPSSFCIDVCFPIRTYSRNSTRCRCTRNDAQLRKL